MFVRVSICLYERGRVLAFVRSHEISHTSFCLIYNQWKTRRCYYDAYNARLQHPYLAHLEDESASKNEEQSKYKCYIYAKPHECVISRST